MANRGPSLLERLSEVLDNLSFKLSEDRSVGGLPNQPTPVLQPTQQPQGKGWLEQTFNGFLDRLGKMFSGNKPGTPVGTPTAVSTPFTAPVPVPMQVQQQAVPTQPLAGGQGIPVLELENVAQQKEDDRTPGQKNREFAKGMQDTAGMFSGAKSQTGKSMGSKAGEIADVAQLGARAMAGDPTAMIGLADKAVQKFENQVEAGKQSVQSFGKAMTTEGAGKTAGALFESANYAGQAIGLPESEILKFGQAVAESVDKLRDMSREMVTMNFRLGEYSASMATAQAQQEMRDIELSMGKGEARAESTAKLAEAMSELNTTLMPLENAWANFSNGVMTNIIQLITILAKIEPATNSIRAILEWWSGKQSDEDDDPEDKTFREFLAEQGNKYGAPKRFQ